MIVCEPKVNQTDLEYEMSHRLSIHPKTAEALAKVASMAQALTLQLQVTRGKGHDEWIDSQLSACETMAQTMGALADYTLLMHEQAPQRGDFQDWLLRREM